MSTSDLDLKSKQRQLFRIERALRLTQSSTQLGPRAGFSLVVGIAVACLVFWIVDSQMETKTGAQILPALAALILAAGVTYLRSKLPRTYVDSLDEKLAKYEPECRAALLRLQNEVSTTGTYDYEGVMQWLTEERYAIQLAMSPQDKKTSQFLKRRL